MRATRLGSVFVDQVRCSDVVTRWELVILCAGVFAVAGCGGDSDTPSPAPPSPPQPAAASTAPAKRDSAQQESARQAANGQPDAALEVAEASGIGAAESAANAAGQEETAASDVDAPPGESPFEMSYLDPATEMFVFARPSAIVTSPIVQALTGGNLGPLDDLKEKFGIGIDQVESVTIGVSQLQQIAQQSAVQMAASMQQTSESPTPQVSLLSTALPSPLGMAEHGIIVVRTIEPVSMDDLDLPDFEGAAKTHESHAYHQLAETGETPPHLYQADDTTLIIATESAIQATIDRGAERSHATADLGFVQTASHMIIAVVPQDRDAFFAQLRPVEPAPSDQSAATGQRGRISLSGRDEEDEGSGKGKPRRKKKGRFADEAEEAERAEAEALAQANQNAGMPTSSEESKWRELMATHGQAVALQIDMDAALRVTLTTQCDLPPSAVRLEKELNMAVDSGKQMYEAFRGSLPGLVQEITQSMVDSLAVTADGKRVSISTSLPESQQANLTMLPVVMMGMMMSQTGSVEAIQPMVDWQDRAQEVLDQGQNSVLTKGVPEGMQVHGLARWSLPEPGREFAHPLLELAIVCTGGPAAHVASFGRLKITEAKVAADVPLKWLGMSINGRSEDPLHDLVVVDHEDPFSPHPPQGIATGVTFHPPSSDVQSLAVIEGEILVEAPTTLREITLSNVYSDQTVVDDPALQSANFSVSTETVDGQIEVHCRYNEDAPLGQISVLDASGATVQASSESRVIDEGQMHREWRLSGGVTQPLGLVVTAREGMQEVSVPFRFENLPMPNPPSQYSGQSELLSWTTAEPAEEFPEGMSLQAQARWHSPLSSAAGDPEALGHSGLDDTAGDSALRINLGRGDELSREEEKALRRSAELSREEEKALRRGGGLSREEEKALRRSGKGGDDDGATSANQFQEDEDDGSDSFRAAEARAVSPEDSLEGRLQFVVDLLGTSEETIVALGDLQVQKAVSNDGLELEYVGGQFGIFDVTNELAGVQQDALPQTDQPPDGLRVIYKFTRPQDAIQAIAEFRGKLHVRTAKERVEVVVPSLSGRTNKRIRDRRLAKYGVEFAVDIVGNVLKYRTLKGDENRLARMIPVDENGDRIDGVSHRNTTDHGNPIHVFQFSDAIPEGVGLQFVINSGVKEIDVPVEFTNVPVPAAPPQLALE